MVYTFELCIYFKSRNHISSGSISLHRVSLLMHFLFLFCFSFRVFDHFFELIIVFVSCLHFLVLSRWDIIFLLGNCLFFLLSLFVGVEGLVDIIVSGGLESSCSSITMSWWNVSSGVSIIFSDPGESVCLLVAVCCWTCWLESFVVISSSVWWLWGDCVFGGESDIYIYIYIYILEKVIRRLVNFLLVKMIRS